ncbi:MAG: RnfABCDGE type electron transport complex subunit A [Clostridiales bacterium]|jgi:electron transport complex protein RnfA|nr:RnfABCDGE type electron transport complex subunit A [Clostridiales bacterium]
MRLADIGVFLFFINAAFSNNMIFSRFLGNCPYLGVSNKLETATGMGVAVVFVMGIASLFCYLSYAYILVPLGLQYLDTITFILIIAALVQLVEMFMKKSLPALYSALGIYLPLITTNCAVLGVALINMRSGYNLIESVLSGVFGAVGFLMAIVLMAGIRERLESSDIPKAFKGFPISLIIAGFMSVAFLGFAGLVK